MEIRKLEPIYFQNTHLDLEILPNNFVKLSIMKAT